MDKCLADGCDRPKRRRGLCGAHSKRLPENLNKPINKRMVSASLAQQLAERTVLDGSCVRWTGSHYRNGYGRFKSRGSDWQLVHRGAYELMVGPVPDGLVLDHVVARGCQFKDCVNPWHLEPVTQRENTLRAGVRQDTRTGRFVRRALD